MLMNWSSAVTQGIVKMAKVYTVTINGKEQFLCDKLIGIRLVNRTDDFYSVINAEVIANALPGLFKSSPEWSALDQSALTFDLNEFTKLFGIKGALKNNSGWGHTMARHTRTNTRITILTDREAE
jgi:hypothetical protein